MQELQSIINVLRQQLSESMQEKDMKAKDAAEERRRMAEQSKLFESVQNDLSIKIAECGQLSGLLKNSEAMASNLSSTLAQLQADFDGLFTKHKSMTEELETQKKLSSKTSKTNAGLKEIVARVTADNLVFLGKIKYLENSAAQAEKETVELRIALKQNDVKWFEHMRREMEIRAREQLEVSESFDGKLEELLRRHESEIKSFEVRLAEMRDSLNAKHSELDEKTLEASELMEELQETKKMLDESVAITEKMSGERSRETELDKLRTSQFEEHSRALAEARAEIVEQRERLETFST